MRRVRELRHLGERVADQLDDAVRVILDDQPAAIDALHENERLIDRHYASIVGFVEQLLQPELPADVTRRAVELVEAADYLESIGDLVDKEMIPLYRRHTERGAGIIRRRAHNCRRSPRRSARSCAARLAQWRMQTRRWHEQFWKRNRRCAVSSGRPSKSSSSPRPRTRRSVSCRPRWSARSRNRCDGRIA